jgi:GntR family transcriptional regulator/MocR family aminotransferase
MAKKTTKTPPFVLVLPPREPGTPATRWLYASLRAEILAGRLRPASRLPATRDLARQYHLSRGTVVSAFEELKAEGYLDGSRGSGTYVSRVLPEHLLQVASSPTQPPADSHLPSRKLSAYAKRLHTPPDPWNRPVRAFRANLPALDLFPTTIWTRLATRRLQRLSMRQMIGCDAMGYAPLRSAIADYLNASRGVKCTAEQVMIVSGTQEAIDLAGRLVLNYGDRVCIEDPGYPEAALSFAALGARISSVAVDAEGMKLPSARSSAPRLLFVTPGHQFPLGITMSLNRRLQLLEWARQSRAFIFEDDYDSEFRYSGRPIPALQGLDRNNLVLFVGSFSKVLFPAIRLGYLVLPPALIDRFSAAKSLLNRHAPPFEQTVLCDFITEGHFARHLRRMREIYAERLSVLMESAQQKLAGLLEISGIEAGLQTIGWLTQGSDSEAVKRAAARNVEARSLSSFYRGPTKRQGLQLGFAAINQKEIRRGIQELAIALQA